MGKNKKTRRDEWKDELDQEFQEFARKGKERTLHVRAKDFPCLIDGMLYNTIQEYVELHGNAHSYRDPLTSRPLDPSKFAPGKKQRSLGFLPASTGGSYPAPPPIVWPAIHLEPNTYRKLDSIQHMNYCVAHTAGGYYAVWVSLNHQDSLEQVMAQLMTMNLPVQVVNVLHSRLHTSQAEKNFYRAENYFHTGGETFSRIKERITKALDPNYIPPNLRKLAVAATFDNEVWDIIPAGERQRLYNWLATGCKGWYGRNPNKQWYKARGIERPFESTPSKGASTSTNTKQDNAAGGDLVWDWKTESWKPAGGWD